MSSGVGMGETAKPRERIKWIDLARAMAILMVLVCHSVEKVYPLDIDHMPLLAQNDQIIAFALFALGRIGVPFFLLISGYLLLDRDYDRQGCVNFYKRRWLPLFIITEVWIVLLALWDWATTGYMASPELLVRRMLFLKPLANGYFWYLPMILGVYLAVPIIGAGLKRIERPGAIALPLAAVAVFALVVPTTSIITTALGAGAVKTYLGIAQGPAVYLLYLALGWVVKRGGFSKVPAVLAALLAVAGFAGCAWMQFWSYGQGLQYNLFYNNVFLLVSSVSLFCLLSRIKVPHPYPLWRALAYWSFAIYLVHNPLLRLITPQVTALALPLPAQLGVYVVVLLAASWAVSLVISVIPFVGKRLLYLK